MHAQREVVDGSLLTTQIIDTDLRIGHTTVVPRLGVRLVQLVSSIATFSVRNPSHPPHSHHHEQQHHHHTDRPTTSQITQIIPKSSESTTGQTTHLVLAVAVASRGTTSHFDGCGRDG